MLPSSKEYLKKGGFSAQAAAWILIGCFVAGFIGIQVVSRVLHSYMPSHVVDCDHSHDDSEAHNHSHDHRQSRSTFRADIHSHGGHTDHSHTPTGDNGNVTESTPLINGSKVRPEDSSKLAVPGSRRASQSQGRRTSMMQVPTRVMSFVKDTKTNCDEGGPCYGYSDPCGQECFKHLAVKTPSASRQPTVLRTATGSFNGRNPEVVREVYEGRNDERSAPTITSTNVTRARSRDSRVDGNALESDDEDDCSEDDQAHHHHVAENAFMSIGLQTSIAIALHKLPEGFITYATNHANPSLGFAVFMALFIHNITEGFAMALPLYLALGSRIRAMFWSSLLGGISQPLGAGIAALWFKVAGTEGNKPGEVVYGCMFAVTSGIMASVAMQLFVESLSLNHNRNLCIGFAFVGMAILGISNALTAK